MAESSSHQTAPSATQSANFAFSAQDLKIARIFAHFLRPKGTGEAWIQASVADLCLILSVENRAGAPPLLTFVIRLAMSPGWLKKLRDDRCCCAFSREIAYDRLHLMETRLKVGFEEVLAELRRRGLMLVHDKAFPSLTGFTIGEPIRGSWWAHPLSNDIYMISQQLQHCGDVTRTKLVSGKETYIHQRLWPHLLAVGIAREAWQLDGLASTATSLLAEVERCGDARLDQICSARTRKELSEDARVLAMRLLVYGDDVHTESGAHVKRLETWQNWAKRHDISVAHLPTVFEARAEFETLIAGANAECPASAFLPWQKKRRP